MTDGASNSAIDPAIEPGWKARLAGEFAQPYFRELREFLHARKAAGATIYPPGSRIFAAFDFTPWDDLKVVIIGQDPYHGHGQANGLCFSVHPGVTIPPSLKNIHKELLEDLGHPAPPTGDLTPWARQGVLLLNATLTVEAGKPASHHGRGWETFTDAVIRAVNEEKTGVVFILWGKNAQQKGAIIDPARHRVLQSPHPSPYSASAGFFGSRPFSKANALLESMGRGPVDWRLA